mmetsp:Transcript_4104/g.6021  ORF Transcript_4104/g.6021 Transcript_4104/m.6021 type:complete len:587 (+) Transcript_4104:4359-6119(+)
MGDRETARLLGVVLEVALGIVVGVLGDQLDRSLVGSDSSVRPETVQQALDGARGEHVRLRLDGEREVGHVVVDADSELRLGGRLLEVGEHRHSHTRGEVLATEAKAAADDLDVRHASLEKSGADVEVEGLALRANVLAAVENSNALDLGRERREELLLHPRAEEANLENANLLAHFLVQVLDSLRHGDSARAHDNHDVLRIGVAVVGEGAVLATGNVLDLLRVLLHDGRHRGVEGVGGFLTLEEHIRALVGSLDVGVVGRERRVVVALDSLPRDEPGNVLVVDHLDLVHLVAGAETIEEVHHRHASLHGGEVRHKRLIHNHLGALRAEHNPTRSPGRHDVRVVAEDVESMRAKSARRHVQNARQELARDLVHVGDHEHETLRSRIGRREGASLEAAVKRTGSTTLGLHLRDRDSLSEAVLQALARPLVNHLTHGGRRRDRVDEGHITESVGDVCGGLVSVDARHGAVLVEQLNVMRKIDKRLVLGKELLAASHTILHELLVQRRALACGSELVHALLAHLSCLLVNTETAIGAEGSGASTQRLRQGALGRRSQNSIFAAKQTLGNGSCKAAAVHGESGLLNDLQQK